jgi:hypothetical protein
MLKRWRSLYFGHLFDLSSNGGNYRDIKELLKHKTIEEVEI